MIDLLDNSILLSFQKLEHLLKAILFTFKKSNVIVIPVCSLVMVVIIVFVEVHSWFSGQGKGSTNLLV